LAMTDEQQWHNGQATMVHGGGKAAVWMAALS